MFKLPGDIFDNAFNGLGVNLQKKINALVPPYGPPWNITFPTVSWRNDTVVLIHLQDFLTFDELGNCIELKHIENHFGELSNRVIVIHWNIDLASVYSGPLHLIYFPTHSYDILQQIKEQENNWKPVINNSARTTNWQCLNGTPRRHRELIVHYLQENYNNGVISLGTKIPLEEWSFRNYIGCDNLENWLHLLRVYSRCKINIVTETEYYQYPGLITEKTLMAFLGLQIPIVIGYPGIVRHCQDLGFDMFEDIVDLSYDEMPNVNRWQKAIDLNRKIINGDINYTQLLDRLMANQDYVLNKWPKLLIEQFNNNVRDTVEYLRR